MAEVSDDPKRIPRLYRNNKQWGDSISWTDYQSQLIHGFIRFPTEWPVPGDLFECQLESGKTGIFRFIKVEKCGDPRDMFTGKTEPVGYKDEIEMPETIDPFDEAQEKREELQAGLGGRGSITLN